jgi:hypothetical protein
MRRVRHACLTMSSTATVRELRNRFPEIRRRLESEGEVLVMGKATLSPDFVFAAKENGGGRRLLAAPEIVSAAANDEGAVARAGRRDQPQANTGSRLPDAGYPARGKCLDEAGRQTRLVATTGIANNGPLYVPTIVPLAEGRCGVRDGRLSRME